MEKTRFTRRRFVTNLTASAAGVTILPRHVLGGIGYVSPNDKLNIGGIGVGGKGRSDVAGVSSENIVALCDVDDERGAPSFERFPRAKRYRDFRVMLEQEKGLDAVTISTADHTHAVAAMAAMQLGKHVFCQKPLAHNVEEVRKMSDAARRNNVATQMGIQGHASDGIRRIRELIEAGAIGQVQEVHYWTNRPIWPQGIQRPLEQYHVPRHLDWDLWLGPAPNRPYHPAYHPFAWRGWWDFGTGALGDIGCHAMDAAFWTLDLRDPRLIVPETTPVNSETAPLVSRLTYYFPPRGNRGEIKVVWRDGSLTPPRPSQLGKDRPMPGGNSGQMFIGDKGSLMAGMYGEDPVLAPEARHEEFVENPPAEKYPPSPGIYEEWIQACKGGPAAGANFPDYATGLTEMVLLGNLAVRIGEAIEWNGEKVTNAPRANEFLSREYRQGWSLS